MTKIRHAAAAACLLFIFACLWGQQPVKADALMASSLVPAGCGGGTAPLTNSAFEQKVVELVNQERARRNLPPLKRVSALDDSSRYFAADMVVDNYWASPGEGLISHGTYDRTKKGLVYVCPWDQRIGFYYPAPTGENLAAGYSKPADVVKGWLNSAGHRANMLSSRSWETGVGFAQGGAWGFYWVEDFGKQPGVYPLIINAEAAKTSSQDVSLYVYGTWTRIRLKNDDGGWSDWQPFSNTISWRLGPGGGTHMVFAEMRSDQAGAIASDSIYLDQPVIDPAAGTSSFTTGVIVR